MSVTFREAGETWSVMFDDLRSTGMLGTLHRHSIAGWVFTPYTSYENTCFPMSVEELLQIAAKIGELNK